MKRVTDTSVIQGGGKVQRRAAISGLCVSGMAACAAVFFYIPQSTSHVTTPRHLKVESDPADMEELRERPGPPPAPGGASRLRASRLEVSAEPSSSGSSRAGARFRTRLPAKTGDRVGSDEPTRWSLSPELPVVNGLPSPQGASAAPRLPQTLSSSHDATDRITGYCADRPWIADC